MIKLLLNIFGRNINKSQTREMSFFEHLDELRSHIFKSAVAIAIGACLVAYYNNFIVRKILMGPMHQDFFTYTFLCRVGNKLNLASTLCLHQIDIKMQSNVVGGQFGVYFNIILIGGFILAFPYVFLQFWNFIKPGLTDKEAKNTRGVIFWVSFLFFIGVLFGYFVLAPYTVNFFANFSLDDNIENLWTINSYFNTIIPLILGAGLAFQLPLVMYFLAKADIVTASYLKRVRKYAVLIIFIVAAIITPPDMLSQIICAIPLVLLYEISILLCKRVENKNKVDPEWS